MIPLKDNIPTRMRPYAVYGLIAVNTVIFLAGALLLSDRGMQIINANFGVIPLRYTSAEHGGWYASLVLEYLPFISYQYLHGGLVHYLLNMWVLWVFADNVEDVMGHGRFVLFYTLCGLAAVVAHIASAPASTLPIIGASGAAAGVMGAYLILYPHARVLTWIPLFIVIPYIVEIPAALFLLLWFGIQILSGLQVSLSGQEGGVAFWAHAGGFVAGIALLPLFRRKELCDYCYHKTLGRYLFGPHD